MHSCPKQLIISQIHKMYNQFHCLWAHHLFQKGNLATENHAKLENSFVRYPSNDMQTSKCTMVFLIYPLNNFKINFGQMLSKMNQLSFSNHLSTLVKRQLKINPPLQFQMSTKNANKNITANQTFKKNCEFIWNTEYCKASSLVHLVHDAAIKTLLHRHGSN